MTPQPNHIALFDLDHTLLPVDSDYEWAAFLIDLGIVDATAHKQKNDLFYEQYKAGTLDIFEFLRFQLKPLSQHDKTQLDAWLMQFMQTRIAPQIKPRAKALVEHHLARQDLCILITATNEFVTAPIARAFGIEHLIAVQLESKDGRYTGAPSGTPSFREGKITRLTAFLEDRGLALNQFASSTFYSDSQNDLPLLERVTHPVAVNPDPTLRAKATAAGWPVLELFA